ncbi:MAG: hypothetical protein ACRC6G_01355 [Deefgea sp.]
MYELFIFLYGLGRLDAFWLEDGLGDGLWVIDLKLMVNVFL